MGVTVERNGATAVVTIDRQERRNALDSEAISSIGEAFSDAEGDDEVRAVVLTGAGDQAFCSGMDLKEFAGATGPRPERRGPGLEVFTTRCYPKPVIAAINGSATGGGFELMLASDMVVAVATATFSVPEVKRGLVGAGCSTRLAAGDRPGRLRDRGARGALLCRSSSGARTGERGGALRPRPRPGPRDSRGPRRERSSAVAMTKQLIWDELGSHDTEEWSAIRAKAAPVFATEDAREGAQAFMEKRVPGMEGALNREGLSDRPVRGGGGVGLAGEFAHVEFPQLGREHLDAYQA